MAPAPADVSEPQGNGKGIRNRLRTINVGEMPERGIRRGAAHSMIRVDFVVAQRVGSIRSGAHAPPTLPPVLPIERIPASPTSAEFGRRLVQLSPGLAQRWSQLDRRWPDVGSMWPCLGQFRPKLAVL